MSDKPQVPAGIADLDRMIHEPARLAILTVLSACESADFTFLQTATGLSKGNLSVQITRLEEANLVTVERVERGRRMVTLVWLTASGRGRLSTYWEQMQHIREHTRIGALSPSAAKKSPFGKQPCPVRS